MWLESVRKVSGCSGSRTWFPSASGLPRSKTGRCPAIGRAILIVGKEGKSAIGTLVERMTGFVMLLHLPDDHGAVAVQRPWSPR
jgi:hypothetical protein